MVQVVQPTPSFGELLGRGVGEGLTEQIALHRQRKEQERQQQQMTDALSKLGEMGSIDDLDINTIQSEIFKSMPDNPQMAQMLVGNVLQSKLMQQKQQASQLAALKAERQEERAQRTEARQISQETRQQAKFEREMEDDQGDIDFVKKKYGEEVNTGKAARAIINSRAQQMFEPTLQKAAAEEIRDFRKNIKETATQAKKELPALKAARAANRKNVTGLGDLGTILYNTTGKEAFLSEDATIFNNAVKNLLGSSRKDLIGGRASQQEFFFIQQLLPSLGKSQSANEGLFNFLMTTKDMQLAEEQALQQYDKEIGGLTKAGPGYEAEAVTRAEALKDGIWEAYRPVTEGKKDLFEQAIDKDPSLKSKQRAISPDGRITFIDKSKIKKAKERGYYIYGN